MSLLKIRSRLELPQQYLRALRSYDPRKQHSKLAGPLFIQLQTVDGCNASCSMCPYSSKKRERPVSYMEPELYEKIITEVKNVGTVRVFAPMLQSEPLLDPHIVDRIRQTKEKLGEKVVVGIVTNGSPLTSTRTQALIEAGIDRIEISIDAVDEETFQKLRLKKIRFNIK